MKICWDNIEKLRYSKRTGKWYDKNNHSYIEIDNCEICGYPFLTLYNNVGKYCDLKCNGKKSINELKNKVFGKLTVLDILEKSKNNRSVCLCKCDCGNIVEVFSTSLLQELTKSCGCLHREITLLDLNNKRFDRLIVKKYTNNGKWLCQCDCGNIFEVIGKSLRNGNTKSCGCLQKEVASKTHMGENHHNWKGGISAEPYCFEFGSKEFKDFIKERDGNKCLNSECNGNSNKLCIHHIDYNKKNCELDNLITLCLSCNTRANFNKEYWKEFYNNIINEKEHM